LFLWLLNITYFLQSLLFRDLIGLFFWIYIMYIYIYWILGESISFDLIINLA